MPHRKPHRIKNARHAHGCARSARSLVCPPLASRITDHAQRSLIRNPAAAVGPSTRARKTEGAAALHCRISIGHNQHTWQCCTWQCCTLHMQRGIHMFAWAPPFRHKFGPCRMPHTSSHQQRGRRRWRHLWHLRRLRRLQHLRHQATAASPTEAVVGEAEVLQGSVALQSLS